jgi:hypothetical protein
MSEQKKWPDKLRSGPEIASALNWIRWRTEGRAMVVIAIGTNGIAIAKDQAMNSVDALELLRGELQNIAAAIATLDRNKSPQGAFRRGDQDNASGL